MNDARAATPKKHLHLGVIHGGRFIHETIITEHKPVSVGTGAGATLTLPPSAHVGEVFRLFEQAGNKYQLAFTEKMSGRISVDNTDVDLATLRAKGLARKQGDLYYLPLIEKARGKVVLGDVCVVFNFAEAPRPVPVMVLPLSVRSNLVGGFDWTFSSAVGITSLIFALFLVYLSTVPVPEEITFEELDDRFAKMIMPKKMEEKKPEVVKADVPKEEKKEEKKKEKPVEEEKEPPTAERRKEVQQKVANKGVLAILGTKGSGKGAIADVFSEGKAINGDIDSVFSGIGGVEVANGTNTTSRGTGGSGTSTSIGSLATSGAGKVGLVEKAETKVNAEIKTEAPEVDGSLEGADIARVVKGRISSIKECYERELKRNPQLAGKIVVRFTIDEEGRVTNATLEENTISEKSVGACVVSRFERFRFPKPDGGSVTVSYPFIFAPSS